MCFELSTCCCQYQQHAVDARLNTLINVFHAAVQCTMSHMIITDGNKTLLSIPTPRPRPFFIKTKTKKTKTKTKTKTSIIFKTRLLSYFCIKISDDSFSVNTNNNTKINNEYIHYTVSKKRHPFYICYNLIRCHPILSILGRNTPGNLEQTQMHREPHLVSCVCTVPCKI